MILVIISKFVEHDIIKVQTNSSPCTRVHHIVAYLPLSENPVVIVILLECIRTPCVLMLFDGVKDYVYVAVLVYLTEKD